MSQDDRAMQREPLGQDTFIKYVLVVVMAVTAVLFAMWIAHISLIVAEYKQSAIQSVIRFITDAPPAQCRGPIGEMPPACAQFLNRVPIFTILCLWMVPSICVAAQFIRAAARGQIAAWWRDSFVPRQVAYMFFCALPVIAGIGFCVI
jgi:hypothetical protein